jgi:prepilin signal peptidase PulO-like enzyme (type II secretory pathway)
VIMCMKFKEVWYLDSAKQHPPLKFLDLQPVLNWLVSCRFCSQKFNLLVFYLVLLTMQGLWYNIFCSEKFNLLVFLIGIADHVGPLVMHRTE